MSLCNWGEQKHNSGVSANCRLREGTFSDNPVAFRGRLAEQGEPILVGGQGRGMGGLSSWPGQEFHPCLWTSKACDVPRAPNTGWLAVSSSSSLAHVRKTPLLGFGFKMSPAGAGLHLELTVLRDPILHLGTSPNSRPGPGVSPSDPVDPSVIRTTCFWGPCPGSSTSEQSPPAGLHGLHLGSWCDRGLLVGVKVAVFSAFLLLRILKS